MILFQVEILKTGGGVYNRKLTTLDDKILCLLKDNFFSIENDFDSNNESEHSNIRDCNIQNEYVCYDENTPGPSHSDHEYYEFIGEDNFEIENEENIDKIGKLYEPPQKKKQETKQKNIKERDITTKKRELLDIKMKVINTMHENEIENLKGKKIDNEIKEIIKEKEMVELQIKKLEYKRLSSNLPTQK